MCQKMVGKKADLADGRHLVAAQGKRRVYGCGKKGQATQKDQRVVMSLFRGKIRRVKALLILVQG